MMWELWFGGGMGSVMRWEVGCLEGVARSAEGVFVLAGVWELGLGLGVFLWGGVGVLN